MVTFEATIKDKKVRLFAKFPLKNAAGAIIKTLIQISEKTNIFNEKFVMCFGWAYFFLSKRKDENGEEYWVVQTTDFRKNPMKDKTDDATDALMIQNMQIEAIQTAKVEPKATTFKDTVLVLKEAIQANEVYLNRSEPEKEGDSGWYLGLLNDPNEDNHSSDDYIIVKSYELMKICMEALRVMQMPVGTVAVIQDKELTALVDKDDNPLKFINPPQREERKKKLREQQAQEAKESAEKTESGNSENKE